MSGANYTRIEQRLHDQARFLVFTADEAFFLLFPIVAGLIGRQLILGVVFGAAAYYGWRKMKGESGLSKLIAAAYWMIPHQLSPFRGFPDAAVKFWRG